MPNILRPARRSRRRQVVRSGRRAVTGGARLSASARTGLRLTLGRGQVQLTLGRTNLLTLGRGRRRDSVHIFM